MTPPKQSHLGSRPKRSKLSKEDKKRRYDRLYKRRKRRENRDKVREQYRIDCARCIDVNYLKKFVREDPSRPGCWIWTGKFTSSWSRILPEVRRGQYGSMLADRAMWLALGRGGLVGKNRPTTSCGHLDCIAPEHLTLTNPTLERARKALAQRP